MHEIRSRHERRMQDHRHARNDFVPRECGQHENIECNDAVDHVLGPSNAVRVASCLICPSCVSTAPANTSSLQSIASSPLGKAGFRKLNRLREYISLAWYGKAAGKFTGPMILTPPCNTVSPALVSSQLPPCSAAISTMTDPAFMRATAAWEMMRGAARPGIDAVLITASLAAMRASSTSCCLAFSSG